MVEAGRVTAEGTRPAVKHFQAPGTFKLGASQDHMRSGYARCNSALLFQEKLVDIIDGRGSQAAKYGITSSGPYGVSCNAAADTAEFAGKGDSWKRAFVGPKNIPARN